MSPRSLVLAALPALVVACISHPTSDPRAAADGAASSRPARPELPPLVPDEADAHACFPADFETTRARVRGDHLELCGLTRGAPRCYSVDPFTSFVRVVEVSDAPRSRPAAPVYEAPLSRREVASRGARIDGRAGTLSVSSPQGRSRTINARSLGLDSLDNGVMAPWGDGWFIAVFGVSSPNLGASGIIDPGKISVRARAAFDPCPVAP